ncbi:MAG TPA: hypothetical protein PKL26_07575, partial [Methanolinea sp.]|nr:hypothetical protein [Methanolinea sp.]
MRKKRCPSRTDREDDCQGILPFRTKRARAARNASTAAKPRNPGAGVGVGVGGRGVPVSWTVGVAVVAVSTGLVGEEPAGVGVRVAVGTLVIG